MAKHLSFDATLKDIIEPYVLRWLKLPVAPARMIEADLSTVSAEADKVLWVDAKPKPWILHLELQADHDL
ncbi:hypothetical protein ACTGYH_12730, partial [Streptococcus suis]